MCGVQTVKLTKNERRISKFIYERQTKLFFVKVLLEWCPKACNVEEV